MNDNLLGAPRKGETIKETSRLGRKGSIIMTDNLLGLPGREQQLRKPGDSGEGRHCDSL